MTKRQRPYSQVRRLRVVRRTGAAVKASTLLPSLNTLSARRIRPEQGSDVGESQGQKGQTRCKGQNSCKGKGPAVRDNGCKGKTLQGQGAAGLTEGKAVLTGNS